MYNRCNHYERNCYILAPCCEEFFPCRLCHDDIKYDKETDFNKSHKIDFTKIEKVRCNICGKIQKISDRCIDCSSIFGEYYCKKCKYLDIDISKKQFHCDKCGICR